MKKHNIEAYLNSELSASERQAFEAQMAADPALATEVVLLRQLTEDLGDAMLWERVGTAQARTNGQAKWQWWAFAGAVLLLCGGLLWYSPGPPAGKMENPAAPSEQQAPGPTPVPTPAETPPTDSGSPAASPTDKQPIAKNNPPADLQPPLHPAPQLRGNNAADTARKALLDAIWYTEYPPEGLKSSGTFEQVDALLRQRDFSKSYARLQLLERKMPANDTLFFLKGYCLLERGEGAEALRYFDRMENKTPFGKELLDWYRGLAFLLLGNDESAKNVCAAIVAKPENRFKKKAERALKMLN